MSQESPFVAIRNHSLNPMRVRAETPQFHLLALAGLNSQRICIYPFIGWDVGRLMSIGKNVKNGWLVDDGQKCHC